MEARCADISCRLLQQAAVASSTVNFMHAFSHLVLSCLHHEAVQQIIMLLSGASVNLYLALLHSTIVKSIEA